MDYRFQPPERTAGKRLGRELWKLLGKPKGRIEVVLPVECEGLGEEEMKARVTFDLRGERLVVKFDGEPCEVRFTG